MIRRPPRSTRTDTLFLYTTLFRSAAGPVMKSNFGRSSYSLDLATRELKPSEYLRRAKELLEKIDLESEALLSGPDNLSSEEHQSELQSLMRISYAVFCLTIKTNS